MVSSDGAMSILCATTWLSPTVNDAAEQEHEALETRGLLEVAAPPGLASLSRVLQPRRRRSPDSRGRQRQLCALLPA